MNISPLLLSPEWLMVFLARSLSAIRTSPSFVESEFVFHHCSITTMTTYITICFNFGNQLKTQSIALV